MIGVWHPWFRTKKTTMLNWPKVHIHIYRNSQPIGITLWNQISSVFINTFERHHYLSFLVTGSGACVSFIWQFKLHFVVSPSGGGHNYSWPFPVSHQPYPLWGLILYPVVKMLFWGGIYTQLKKLHFCPVDLTGEEEERKEWRKVCSQCYSSRLVKTWTAEMLVPTEL